MAALSKISCNFFNQYQFEVNFLRCFNPFQFQVNHCKIYHASQIAASRYFVNSGQKLSNG